MKPTEEALLSNYLEKMLQILQNEQQVLKTANIDTLVQLSEEKKHLLISFAASFGPNANNLLVSATRSNAKLQNILEEIQSTNHINGALINAQIGLNQRLLATLYPHCEVPGYEASGAPSFQIPPQQS